MTTYSAPPPAPLCACGCGAPVIGGGPHGSPKIYATRRCGARERQRRARGGRQPPVVVLCRVCRKGVVRIVGPDGRNSRGRYHPDCAKLRRYLTPTSSTPSTSAPNDKK